MKSTGSRWAFARGAFVRGNKVPTTIGRDRRRDARATKRVCNGGNDGEDVGHVGVRMYACACVCMYMCMCGISERQRVVACDVRRFYFYGGHGQKIALQVTCDDSWCVPAVHALLYLRTMHCGG